MDYNGIINILGIIMELYICYYGLQRNYKHIRNYKLYICYYELYICYYGLQRNYKLVIKNYNGIIYLLLWITTEL